MKRMMTLISATCVLAATLAASPASSQDGPSVHPVLETALSRAPAATDETQWRFVVTMTSGDGTLVGRFDGTRPDGQRWELVSPTEDDLSDLQSGLWSGLQEPDEDEDEDSGLFFSVAGSGILPGSLELAEQTSDDLIFDFRPDLDADEAAMADYIRGALTVSRDSASVTRLRLWAPESFKPHFAVRLNRFDMIQEFSALEGLPAPVLTRMSQVISGRAAFQSFDQSFDLAFSEIEFLGGAVDVEVDRDIRARVDRR